MKNEAPDKARDIYKVIDSLYKECELIDVQERILQSNTDIAIIFEHHRRQMMEMFRELAIHLQQEFSQLLHAMHQALPDGICFNKNGDSSH